MRLIAVLLLVAACAPAPGGGRDAPFQAGAQPGFPRLGGALPAGHTRYSHESLADLFVFLTHDLEWGARRPHLVRYEAPVSVGITGPGSAQYIGFLDAFLAQMRARAGIAISRGAAPHNLLIRFVPGGAFRARVPRHFCVVAPGALTWEQFRAAPERLGTRAFETQRRLAAMTVFIPDTAEPYLVRTCLIEEIAQALGPANDLYGLGSSIFNDDAAHIWPTRLDYLMLRVLYQPEMRTGLNRRETRARARAVLARINPDGAGAPPLPRPRQRRMTDWAEEIRKAFDRSASRDSRVAAARRAVAKASSRDPEGAYHCRALRALGRVARGEPATATGAMARAAEVCARAHGPGDVRLALIRLARAEAAFRAGRASEAYGLSEGLASRLAAFGHDERLVALYALQAASLRAIQQGARSFDARRLAAEWGAYALGRDHRDVRRWLTD